MTNELFSQLIDYIISSTNTGSTSASLVALSLIGNYYLYKKLDEAKQYQIVYENIFRILEPILKKIINKEKLNETDIDDVKKIREIINFKFKNDI